MVFTSTKNLNWEFIVNQTVFFSSNLLYLGHPVSEFKLVSWLLVGFFKQNYARSQFSEGLQSFAYCKWECPIASVNVIMEI